MDTKTSVCKYKTAGESENRSKAGKKIIKQSKSKSVEVIMSGSASLYARQNVLFEDGTFSNRGGSSMSSPSSSSKQPAWLATELVKSADARLQMYLESAAIENENGDLIPRPALAKTVVNWQSGTIIHRALRMDELASASTADAIEDNNTTGNVLSLLANPEYETKHEVGMRWECVERDLQMLELTKGAIG